jgi:hypothetical protein
LKPAPHLDYEGDMACSIRACSRLDDAVSPSRRTLHAEMLRLCARIGFSPPRRL